MMKTLSFLRTALAVAALSLAAQASFAHEGARPAKPAAVTIGTLEISEAFSRATLPNAQVGGGSYSLVDGNNQPVDQTMLMEHPSLLFFGFTHCPEVCPTTLSEMAGWFTELGDEAKALKAYYVTVDPGREGHSLPRPDPSSSLGALNQPRAAG